MSTVLRSVGFVVGCLLITLSGCAGAIDEPDVTDTSLEGTPLEDDIQTIEQHVGSSTPYYEWSSRNDHLAPEFEQCSPNLLKILAYMKSRWGGQSLGCHGNRFVKGQGNSTTWSTHAWGAALDFSATGGWATNFGPLAGFLIEHSEELGINALHDYRRVAHPDGTTRGRIWKPGIGWRPSNIGSPGTWIHVEVRPDAYSDGRTVEQRLAGAPSLPAAGTMDFAFDAAFYLAVNRDVAAAYGAGNTSAAATHWELYGRGEGRVSSPVFSGQHYLAAHPDILAWAGGSYTKAVEHWLQWGINEGRESSPNFNAGDYLARHPDVAAAVGTNYALAASHYLAYGLSEGRRASSAFDPVHYLAVNPDVANAVGATNYRGALEHWLAYGRAEGRSAVP